MSGKVEELKEKDFNQIIKEGNVLIEFSAPWCHGCQVLKPYLNELAKIYNDDVKFYEVEVLKNPGLALRMSVMSLPNILIFQKGKVRSQIIGTTSKKVIEDNIKKILK